jgi:hypothetical protein
MISNLYRLFTIIGTTFLLVGCSIFKLQPSVPVPTIPASAFLLEADVFPKKWVSFSDESGVMVAGRSFGIPNAPGQVFQEVYRRPNNKKASEKFEVYLEGEFNVSIKYQPAVPFAPPLEIPFKSKIADEYYFACGVNEVPQCKMLARYRNYFVFFYFDLSTKESLGGLTYSEIEHVLESLESKVSEALSASTDATPTK